MQRLEDKETSGTADLRLLNSVGVLLRFSILGSAAQNKPHAHRLLSLRL